MKKGIILVGFIIVVLINCGSPDESMQAISEAEKMEIIKYETNARILEAKKEEIENSTKELEEFLKEL